MRQFENGRFWDTGYIVRYQLRNKTTTRFAVSGANMLAMYQYHQSATRLIAILAVDAVIGLCLWFTPIGKVFDAVLAIALLGLIVGYYTQRITVEGGTVTLTTGILSQKTTEIPLEKINAVTVKRGAFGRIFDYGTLTILTGNDTSGIKFVGLDRPDEVKRRLKRLQS